MSITGALKEYSAIVEGTRKEYTQEELTVSIIRQDHPELDFMDDEEIQEIIDFANKGRVIKPKSYIETLSEQYGWPLKIKARGYIAYLCDIQPLNKGEQPLPIYRFPGGVSLVDEREMIPAE